MNTRVVIWDQLDEVPAGEIVEKNTAQVLVARRVVTLPVAPELLDRNGLSGWNKRDYGKGIALDRQPNQRACPIVLYVQPTHQFIHWTARVIPTGVAKPHGHVRLASDRQPNTMSIGLRASDSPVAIHTLGEPDKWGGWTIGGEGQFVARNEGFTGMSLYGRLDGCRVLWLAVSQTG